MLVGSLYTSITWAVPYRSKIVQLKEPRPGMGIALSGSLSREARITTSSAEVIPNFANALPPPLARCLQLTTRETETLYG